MKDDYTRQIEVWVDFLSEKNFPAWIPLYTPTPSLPFIQISPQGVCLLGDEQGEVWGALLDMWGISYFGEVRGANRVFLGASF